MGVRATPWAQWVASARRIVAWMLSPFAWMSARPTTLSSTNTFRVGQSRLAMTLSGSCVGAAFVRSPCQTDFRERPMDEEVSRVRHVAVALLTVVIGAAVGADTQQQPPTFRTDTDLVRLNVTVLDKDRRPIRGLPAEDFVVRVNGQQQPVVVAVEESATAPIVASTG